MQFENLIKLVNAVSESELTGFSYEEDGVKIKLQKEKKTEVISGMTVQPVQAVTVSEEIAGNRDLKVTETANVEKVEETASAGGKVVVSPLVGTFYVAPAEDAEPFVKVGDAVKKGQTLAIVEAMKLMNEIESDFDGVIEEVLVSNGQPVEYNQPLFRLK